jgi:hypothetical protein
MSHADYSKLIDAICELKKIEPSPEHHRKLDIVVEGSAVTLLPSGHGGEVEALAYFVDFGALPQEDRETASARLLETNLFMIGRDSPAFCLNPDTDHVLLAGCIPLERTMPESLLESLASFAEYAAYWRASHFLSPEERGAAAPHRTGTSTGLGTRLHP